MVSSFDNLNADELVSFMRVREPSAAIADAVTAAITGYGQPVSPPAATPGASPGLMAETHAMVAAHFSPEDERETARRFADYDARLARQGGPKNVLGGQMTKTVPTPTPTGRKLLSTGEMYARRAAEARGERFESDTAAIPASFVRGGAIDNRAIYESRNRQTTPGAPAAPKTFRPSGGSLDAGAIYAQRDAQVAARQSRGSAGRPGAVEAQQSADQSRSLMSTRDIYAARRHQQGGE